MEANKRYELEFSDGKSNKFWAITVDGTSFSVHYGRIGTNGQQREKELGTEDKALEAAEKQMQSKLKKGYVEVGQQAAAPAPAKKKAAKKKTAAKKSAQKKKEGTKTEAAAAEPETPATGDLVVSRSIAIAPGDWARATWRPRLMNEMPELKPFDLDDCLARAARVKVKQYGYFWDWRPCEISISLDRQEAHFWFVAMTTADDSLKPKGLVDKLRKGKYTGELTLSKQIRPRLVKRSRYMRPELLLPLSTLITLDEVLALIGDKKFTDGAWDLPDHMLNGFQMYVLPYMTDAEVGRLRDAIRPDVAHTNWPAGSHYTRPPNKFFWGSFLGLHEEMRAVVSTWDDKLYSGEDWLDHYQKPQLIVFGLGSADEVQAEMRRMRLHLRKPLHIRTWLAHTEYDGLDQVRDSVLAEKNKEEAAALLQAFCLVDAPEAAPHMLKLKLSSKAPAVARQWLADHPANAIAGLLETAAGHGALAEAAVDWLREMKRKGYADFIAQQVDRAPDKVAGKVRALVVDHVEKVYEVFDEQSTPGWLADALAKVKMPKKVKMPTWLVLPDLPPLVVDDKRLDDGQVEAVIIALRGCDLESPHELLSGLKEHGDGDAGDAFSWKLFQLWMGEGAPTKDKWALMAVGHLGGNASALRLTPMVRAWPGESQHKRAVIGLDCLRGIGTNTALMQLNGIAQKLKFKALKARALEAMEQIAQKRGMTRAELEDLIVPDCDLDERGTRVFDFGSRTFRFVLGPQMKPMVRDEAGKVRVNPPKPAKKDDADKAARALKEWKLLKKQVREVARIQAVRLEQAMVTGRRWEAADFERLLVRHPLMTNLVRLLVWGVYDDKGKLAGSFRVTEEMEYADSEDEGYQLPKGRQVGVVHPLHLSESVKGAWGQVLSDYELIPPFLQIGRPIHTLDKGEVKAKEITRFKGPSVPAVSLVSTLEKLGWARGIPEDGGVFYEHTKPYYSAGVTAVVQYEGVPVGYMVDWEDQHVDTCFFLKGIYTPEMYPDHKKKLPLGKVDPLVISEVLADLSTVAAKGS